MARNRPWEQLYAELLDRYGRKIADAFLAAIEDLRSAADVQRVVTALEAGNIEAAVEALRTDPAAYSDFLDVLQQGYTEAGKETASGLSGRRPDGASIHFRFDVRSPRAEEWLRTEGGALIRQVLEEQRQAARQALVAGMEQGKNPRAVALDVVGRLDRATGTRTGGVLGLTSQQEVYARTAEAELRSGDPDALRNYLSRGRRDKRFDRTVQKAIADEKPVPADTAQKMVAQYRSRLLALRGEIIGRTEALRALNAGQYEALLQAVDSGQIEAAQIRRVWKSARDRRVRDTHSILDGDSVGLLQPFQSPSGALLRFPGDPAAPAAESIACRCWTMPRIDWAANVR